MDQKRFLLWILLSVGILVVFEFAGKRLLPATVPPAPVAAAQTPALQPQVPDTGAAHAASAAEAETAPRLKIDADAVAGSINLLGARFDDLTLTRYRETLAKDAPQVLLFAPSGTPQPYYAEFGWSAAPGVKVPGPQTLFTTSSPALHAGVPVTLAWDNGAGLVFQLIVSVDKNYMFTVRQRVENHTGAPVTVCPWGRIHRESPKNPAGSYTVFGQQRQTQKLESGNYILFEGELGVLDGTLHQQKYGAAIKAGASNGGVAQSQTAQSGWIGLTDKYWLAALIPSESSPIEAAFRGSEQDGIDSYQVDLTAAAPVIVPAHGDVMTTAHLFAGAKVVDLLERYQAALHIPDFWKAVDFGIFWFLTRPFFAAIDWLYRLTGNFGIAILLFTVLVKAVFFPLANKSYRSMAKMRDVGPKMQALRERYKDDAAKLQTEMMALYKKEGINPASGCLPMLVQVPVFFSLYKVIYVTIAMRQAPFFGWIRDLSAPDPTNVFNLFGLIPFDPSALSPSLHLGLWPLIMGVTMYAQQRLNPPPPDPTQAKLFQFMPIVFTFMMGRFPSGLVIYWSWNNLLSVAQQWLIMRRAGQQSGRPAVVKS